MPHRAAFPDAPADPADAASFIQDYLLYLLARASQDLSAEFHARLRRMGFSIREWRVLATLSGPAGVTVGTLAEACLTQQPTMTKLLDRMERAGLVARTADPGDRRRTTVTITTAGRTRVAGMLAAARAHEAEILTRLGPIGEDLKDALRRLLAHPR
ncbi:MarR family winged helix-turn-helix transcriptional regulator [Roseomonas sp. CCTCC AB2023176]|uniref:MarR family winged helix-turn-helix transcriptional regulator n=1 Tax=Roseomonas sp. CCTCC AB2023176 TaxID=3342640 RepID=UPI0035D75238